MVKGITIFVRWSVMADSQRRSEESSTEIRACLEPSIVGVDPRGAYAIPKPWYCHAYAQAPKPSQTDMEKVRGDFHNPYKREEPHPPGLPLATHVDPDKVND